MQTFRGFEPTDGRRTAIPSVFFSELLPMIDDLDELKITLFCMWALQQREGEYRYLLHMDFAGAMADIHGVTGVALDLALGRAVTRGTLLMIEVPIEDRRETLYFANSPAGRTAIEQIQRGEWLPGDAGHPVQILRPRPSIFKLYEDNIGALTPLIVDDLKDTEAEFGIDALAEAIRYAVQAEKRSLRYIRAVLEAWRREGKIHATDRRDSGQLLSGEYSDFFER